MEPSHRLFLVSVIHYIQKYIDVTFNLDPKQLLSMFYRLCFPFCASQAAKDSWDINNDHVLVIINIPAQTLQAQSASVGRQPGTCICCSLLQKLDFL